MYSDMVLPWGALTNSIKNRHLQSVPKVSKFIGIIGHTLDRERTREQKKEAAKER